MGFFDVTRTIFVMNWKESLAWRFSMMMSIISGPVWVAVLYFIWAAVFAASGQTVIRGFTLAQMLVYLISSHFIFFLIWDNVDDVISRGVVSGNLINYLLKPLSMLYYEFVGKVASRCLALMIEVIPAVVLIGLMFGFELLKGHWFYYAASALIAFMVFFLLNVILGITAFWFVKVRGVRKIYNHFFYFASGSFFPLSLFPLWLQNVLVFLPFQWIAYAPAQLFLGRYSLGSLVLSPVQALLLGAANVLVLLAIVLLLWKLAIRKFTGAGA